VSRSLRSGIGVAPPFDFVLAGGTRIAFSRRGTGQPILCLHATGHGSADFIRFSDLVAHHGFEVITIDWPGHGNSPQDATGAPVSAARYAQIAGDFARTVLGDRRPIIIGSSIGGMAALIMAAAQAEHVRALVLCNSGGLAPIDRLTRFACSAMTAMMGAGVDNKAWFPVAFSLYYRLVLPSVGTGLHRSRIVAAAPETVPRIKEAWESFRLPEADLRPVLAKLDLPILFAWAMSDKFVSWSRSQRAIEAYPHGEIAKLSGGHLAFLEDADRFAEIFLAFAQRCGAKADRILDD
jgi:4,5:9,10-diseco-3-hydroxy-5,9,17-trioxoandrosta-1(10),2-diene-4-oate hydrolase